MVALNLDAYMIHITRVDRLGPHNVEWFMGNACFFFFVFLLPAEWGLQRKEKERGKSSLMAFITQKEDDHVHLRICWLSPE